MLVILFPVHLLPPESVLGIAKVEIDQPQKSRESSFLDFAAAA
jgi:hypothetical protein